MSSPQPMHLISLVTPEEWMDYNGHMNIAHYTTAVDRAMDAFLVAAGLGEDHVRNDNGSMFVIQQQFHYLKEICNGEPFDVTLQMLACDEKRFHVFLRMLNPSNTVQFATSEVIAIHVDLDTRKSSVMPQSAQTWLSELLNQHQALPRPRFAGHKLSIGG